MRSKREAKISLGSCLDPRGVFAVLQDPFQVLGRDFADWIDLNVVLNRINFAKVDSRSSLERFAVLCDNRNRITFEMLTL